MRGDVPASVAPFSSGCIDVVLYETANNGANNPKVWLGTSMLRRSAVPVRRRGGSGALGPRFARTLNALALQHLTVDVAHAVECVDLGCGFVVADAHDTREA